MDGMIPAKKTYTSKSRRLKLLLSKHPASKRYKNLKSRYQSWKFKNFRGSNQAVPFLFNLVSSIIIGSSFIESGPPPLLAFIIASLVTFLALTLARGIILWLVKPLFKNNPKTIYMAIQLLVICIGIWTASTASAGDLALFPLVLIGIFLTWIELMFVRSLYNCFIRKIYSITLFFTMAVTMGINILAGLFFFGPGFTDTYRQEFLKLNEQSQKKINYLEDNKEALKKGIYQTASVEYGMEGEELISDTANLSNFIYYEGFTKWLRDLYWGYSIDKVPLKGKVWYPSTGEDYPVVFMIHGNHILTTDSYLGYTYLGEYLASYGYVVVSVDENFCNGYINNGLSHENDGRAVLLLENMKLLESYNQKEENPLYGKMDFEKITLAGHSRGGEAAAIAALFNQLEYYPDNGNIQFSYNFQIQSVIAIAPVSDQYQPSGRDVELTDINYLLLHGSNDQDVSYMMGEKQYNNITYTGQKDYFKSYLYIAGANHGQFNTKWGRIDLPEPVNLLLNTKNLIKGKEQRDILLITVKAFLDATIKKDIRSKEFFKDYAASNISLPKTIYLQGYGDSTMYMLCDYEEDTDLTTGAPGVSLSAYGASRWYEDQMYNEIDSEERDNYALSFYWKSRNSASRNSAYYRLDLQTPYRGGDTWFQFDLMDLREEASLKSDWEALDFSIVFTDSEGKEAEISLKEYYTIYPGLPVKTTKTQFITNTPLFKHYFQTVRLPLHDFIKESGFNENSIVRISFLFNKQENGQIRLDKIGFSN